MERSPTVSGSPNAHDADTRDCAPGREGEVAAVGAAGVRVISRALGRELQAGRPLDAEGGEAHD
jgi:hypothetical protein